jgi:hypothetical protein
MPLPSVAKYGANKCQVKCKRTHLPCKNPSAYGCKACRIHGAHKSRVTKKGKDHPKYRHGNETKEAKLAKLNEKLRVRQLIKLGKQLGIFN